MKKIVLSRAAKEALASLPKKDAERMVKKLKRMAETGAGNIERLTGSPYSRLRSGDYRAVFEEDAAGIRVQNIAGRRDVYKKRR
jgi:mRNA interferase RelE/StbE